MTDEEITRLQADIAYLDERLARGELGSELSALARDVLELAKARPRRDWIVAEVARIVRAN